MTTTVQAPPAPRCSRCGGPTGVARGQRAAWIAACAVCGNVQAVTTTPTSAPASVSAPTVRRRGSRPAPNLHVRQPWWAE